MNAVRSENRARVMAAVIAACVLAACGGTDEGPEAAIRAWVAEGHQAAENKDRGALIDMVAAEYADSRGNNRNDIENLLRFYFLRQQKVALITRIDELTVFGDTAAEVTLQVGMAGTNDNVLGFSADAYRIEMELVREGDDWLLTYARWGGLGEDVR